MCQTGRLKRMASGWGLLFRCRVGTLGPGAYAWYVTPRTAMRLIIVIRAWQAEKILNGRDPIREYMRMRRKRVLNGGAVHT